MRPLTRWRPITKKLQQRRASHMQPLPSSPPSATQPPAWIQGASRPHFFTMAGAVTVLTRWAACARSSTILFTPATTITRPGPYTRGAMRLLRPST